MGSMLIALFQPVIDSGKVPSISEHWDVLVVLLGITLFCLMSLAFYVYRDFKRTYEEQYTKVIEQIQKLSEDLAKKVDNVKQEMAVRIEELRKELYDKIDEIQRQNDERSETMRDRDERRLVELHKLDRRLLKIELAMGIQNGEIEEVVKV